MSDRPVSHTELQLLDGLFPGVAAHFSAGPTEHRYVVTATGTEEPPRLIGPSPYYVGKLEETVRPFSDELLLSQYAVAFARGGGVDAVRLEVLRAELLRRMRVHGEMKAKLERAIAPLDGALKEMS